MREPTSLPSDTPAQVVFILDCDNTLLDNDALKVDLDTQLHALLGEALTARFWQVYEEVRALTGTVDFPLTFERFRPFAPDTQTQERLRAIIMDYPFAARLYPESLATLDYLKTLGLPAIVSDGDSMYQPLKIEQSGLASAVDWRVLIYVHKEDHLEEVFMRWPALFYVMVDDKRRILSATKERFPDRFVTVQVRQGHYGVADDPSMPPPDITIDAIGDLRSYRLQDFAPHLRVS